MQALQREMNVLSVRLFVEGLCLNFLSASVEFILHLSPVLNSLCRGCVLVNPGV